MKKIFTAFFIFMSVNLYSQIPPVTIVQSNNPSPGKIFYSNLILGGSPSYVPYVIMFNNDGSVHFSRQMPFRTFDWKKQTNNLFTYFKEDNILDPARYYYVLNNNFSVTDSFKMVSPLPTDTFYTDFHDFQMLQNGHTLIVGGDYRQVNMSVIVPGGHPNARVLGYVIQEMDENRNVVFEWNTFDHFQITDAIGVNLTTNDIDPWHWNAIEQDTDGNFLISCRHSSEITKISRTTGQIIWRLGGRNNQFVFINDPVAGDTMQHFSYQHDIRRLPNGNITLFDNGNFKTPQESRAVEYSLDEVNKICTRVWQFKHVPAIYGFATGSAQRLTNGNTFISWGTQNIITEVTPSGSIALEMTFPVNVFSYRTYKFELENTPLTLNLTLIPQGYFNVTRDVLNMQDTVRAYLRNNISPYAIVDSAIAVIDTVSATGVYNFENAATGNYYIVVKHRNSIETWSKVGGETLTESVANNYSFINAQSQAYGNNLKNVAGQYCLYQGDINHDGIIDATDEVAIENASGDFLSGYVDTDLTGDGIVDALDLLIADNNVFSNIMVQRP
ncbi:MAG: arylsulfotransferase family protein [Ignavibacteria bacterium]